MSKLIALPSDRNNSPPLTTGSNSLTAPGEPLTAATDLGDSGLVPVWFAEDLEEIDNDELRERAAAALAEADAITDAFGLDEGGLVDWVCPIANVADGKLTCNVWFVDGHLLEVAIEHGVTIMESVACAVLMREIRSLPHPSQHVQTVIEDAPGRSTVITWDHQRQMSRSEPTFEAAEALAIAFGGAEHFVCLPLADDPDRSVYLLARAVKMVSRRRGGGATVHLDIGKVHVACGVQAARKKLAVA